MKARSHNENTLPAPLPKTEWNFEKVQQSEIEACYLYEYSREYFKNSPTLQKLRIRWLECERWWREKRQPRPRIPRKHERGHIALLYFSQILEARLGYSAPFDLTTFPELGWLDLRGQPGLRSYPVQLGRKQAEGRQRRRKHASDRFHIETLAQLEPAGINTLEAWNEYHNWFHRDQDQLNTERGFFTVNWDYSISELKRSFAEWLKNRASERKHRPKISTGSRGQARDRLRWLGALRMRNHYRKKDLVDYADSNLKVDAPYSHYPDLLESAKKAEELLGRIFPSEDEAAHIALQSPKETEAAMVSPPSEWATKLLLGVDLKR